MQRRALALAVIALGAGACHKKTSAPAAPAASVGNSAAPTQASAASASSSERRTTAGSIAVNNLSAQIAGLERLGDRSGIRAQLISLYGTRAQFLGRLDDYDVALKLAEDEVKLHPQDPNALMARSGARASMHLFAAAGADLDAAEKLHADPEAVRMSRVSLWLAQGQAQKAVDALAFQNAHHPTITSLGIEAMARAELGDSASTGPLFDKALAVYRDVSPFAVAWLEFHRALLAEQQGHLADAEKDYADAVARLPAYAQAQAHLAAVEALTGHAQQATERLKELVPHTDDPEYLAQLATLVPAAEAKPLIEKAAARYDALLAKHPEAFSDHAARFWLGAGNKPEKALPLARANLVNRQTGEAYELVLEAALAAHAQDVLCPTAQQAASSTSLNVALHVALQRAFKQCGNAPLADAQTAWLKAH